jgi:hypothetical protein
MSAAFGVGELTAKGEEGWAWGGGRGASTDSLTDYVGSPRTGRRSSCTFASLIARRTCPPASFFFSANSSKLDTCDTYVTAVQRTACLPSFLWAFHGRVSLLCINL